MKWPSDTPPPKPPRDPPPIKHDGDEEVDFDLQRDSAVIEPLLRGYAGDDSGLRSALDRSLIRPRPALIRQLMSSCEYSFKPLHTLFLWAETRPGYRHTAAVFNTMIELLAKSREFDSAWLLIDRYSQADDELVSHGTFTILIRRYARARMPQAAIRTFHLMERFGIPSPNFDILLDALCKEGLIRSAEAVFRQRQNPPPSTTSYNILLNGWFRCRKLRHAEKLFAEMRAKGVNPTIVTYGTLIEGYCRMRRVERAMELIEEMKKVDGIEPNIITYNPIVDALGESQRSKEALTMVEKITSYGLEPTISTYNSLVKGFCKEGNLLGASRALKSMIGKGCLPTPTTYNYFFRFFAKSDKIEEGMNLYRKMVEMGHTPDRLSYHLLVKMLCERGKLDMAAEIMKEMSSQGCDPDLAIYTMLVHLLCRLNRLEEAYSEFMSMIEKGLTPQYLTYQRLVAALKKAGMVEMANKISDLMSAIPHSKGLPDTYKGDDIAGRGSLIIKRAQAVSDVLKSSRNEKEKFGRHRFRKGQKDY
ncbi:Pentatricopeptide repeat-containing protein [Nymphaea thermarum]|nr:Pentatricopeptide repeat-containing protein [Nymphaea thermarum]